MTTQLWPLCRVGTLLIASAPAIAAPPTEPVDPPSIELLEYLAEFERSGDGELLDPLDMQREGTDDVSVTTSANATRIPVLDSVPMVSMSRRDLSCCKAQNQMGKLASTGSGGPDR